jgi:protein ImuB
MCIYLPSWPLQRLLHERPELRGKPVAIVDRQAPRGARVVLCSTAALRAGVKWNMPAAEASAICRDLHIFAEAAAQDLTALKQLAAWAERYSPVVGLEETPAPQCLLLDIAGCAACFHGEEPLVRHAARKLQGQGWTTRIAVADSVGAAWGLAHYAAIPGVAPPGATETALRPLPVAALRLPAEAIETLAALGIEQIGQLADLPRSDLPARFGPAVLQRFDQALGNIAELIVPHHELPDVRVSCSFGHATDSREILNEALEQLCKRIHAILEKSGQGARQVDCWLYHEAASPRRVEVRFVRAARSAPYLGELLRMRLEQLQLGEPVYAMALCVPVLEPWAKSQTSLFEANDAEGLAMLVDRLSSRLGHEAVTRAALVQDAQPEYACRFEPLVQTRSARSRAGTLACPTDVLQVSLHSRCFLRRPLRLWPTPVRLEVVSVVPEGPPCKLRWAGTEYRVARAWGPERIETGWWRGQDVHRDYYIAETHLGNRFWLFRRPDDGRWFLHGCFD